MSRLSDTRRNTLVNDILRHRFYAEEQKVREALSDLAEEVYFTAYTEEILAKMELLELFTQNEDGTYREGRWWVVGRELKCNFYGYAPTLVLRKGRPMSPREKYHTHTFEEDHPFTLRFKDIDKENARIKKERWALKNQSPGCGRSRAYLKTVGKSMAGGYGFCA